MRKVLLLLFLLMIGAQHCVHAQRIRVEQYTLIMERTVTRNEATCYKYIYTGVSGGNHDNCIESSYPPGQDPNPSPWYGYCYVEDADCGCRSADFMRLKLYNPDGSYNTLISGDISLGSIQMGEVRVFHDTMHYMQSPINLARVETEVWESAPYDPSEWQSPNFNVGCNDFRMAASINSPAPMEEYTSETYSYHGRYNVATRVRLIPNLDPTFNLPSHDKVLMQITGSGGFIPLSRTWQYLNETTNSWENISSSFTSQSGKVLKISGYDLFGDGYINHLNSNVKFRFVNNSTGAISDPVTFTLRLSSPHIVSVSPSHLNCFERNEGSMKITFDRALLPAEKLNILLLDTLHKVNYSAFNLTSLGSDNSYTWPNELRSGPYYVSLIGKYAKGLEYDLTVNSRSGSPSEYIAMNSVNFEDGFNTPDDDGFNSFTDYTSYSQATYTGALNHIAFTYLMQPQKIQFEAVVQNNVLCKGSATGSIRIMANGGFQHSDGGGTITTTFKYSYKREGDNDYSPWVNFVNHSTQWISIGSNPAFYGTQEVVNNLKGGKYTLRVRDEVDCYAKDAAGNERTYSFTITEPEKGITLDLLEISPITSSTASDAQVKVQISGGTPFINGEIFHYPYTVTFTDSATNQQVALTNTILEANKRMESITALLDAGTYYLRIYDVYYPGPTDPGGCFFEMKIPIRKPDPLLVSIASKKPISCYDSTDGKLVAKATGGIPIANVGYTFKWYKVTNEGNTLLTDTDSLLENVAAGSYQVEVTDKYNNKKTSQTFVFTQPTPLLLNATSLPTNCYTDSNGVLQVAVTGGTPFGDGSYTYEWSTGARTAVVNKVLGGDYIIVVTDSMFCLARSTVSVTSPVRILPNPVITQVSCRGKCDGQIALSATGGQGIYTYTWSTGATTATINNLCPGTYWYKVQDIGGCSESDTIIITNPDTLAVSLGADRKICIGQTIRLNATASDTAVLTYNWQSDNGFAANTAKVVITAAGTYRVAVSNRGGCVVKDTIVITGQNSTVNTDYVVSTQAFVNETVTLVNISQPRTDSVKWLLPSIGNSIRPVMQTNDKCELIFSDTGRYAITMEAYYASGCIDDTTKTVNVINGTGSVNSGSQSNAFLQSFGIFPNPNNGQFAVNIKFSETTRARLRLINSLTNVIVDDRLIQGFAEYHESYNVNALMSGVYILVIDAAKGSFVYKVIIAH